jgi:transcriptional regulator GlxA family with amidase domain
MRRDITPTARSGRRVARVSELVSQTSRERSTASNRALVTVPSTDRRICRVVQVLAQDLSRRIPLTEAAKIAGLTPTYFSSCFRKSVGITFIEWSARLRVGEAKKLLAISDLSITAVAAIVGYPDVTTFERVFGRTEGRCPRRYRDLLQRDRVIVRNAESNVRNAETSVSGSPYLQQSVQPVLLSVSCGASQPNRPRPSAGT